MSFMDAQAGRILAALEANGLAANTAVAFWGDHGWNLGEHGAFCKQTNFETVARIPLMMRIPWLKPVAPRADANHTGAPTRGPTRCEALVEAVDIYPTLLDLAGLEAERAGTTPAFEGDSFVPVLRSALSGDPGGGSSCAAIRKVSRGTS